MITHFRLYITIKPSHKLFYGCMKINSWGKYQNKSNNKYIWVSITILPNGLILFFNWHRKYVIDQEKQRQAYYVDKKNDDNDWTISQSNHVKLMFKPNLAILRLTLVVLLTIWTNFKINLHELRIVKYLPLLLTKTGRNLIIILMIISILKIIRSRTIIISFISPNFIIS
jgi:hypothetical protein